MKSLSRDEKKIVVELFETADDEGVAWCDEDAINLYKNVGGKRKLTTLTEWVRTND